MDINQKLTKKMSPQTESERQEMCNIPYQELIGSLLFTAQVSRPDISYAVNCLSRFNQNPGKAHWVAAKRVLRYLKGTSNLKMCYSREETSESLITGYCDADYAGDVDERKSITGYIFKMQGGAISWCSRKQPTVALSTTEAEYMAMSMAIQEVLWLNGLQNELLPDDKQNIILFCDNQGAICLSSTTVYHARTKHIDVRHHFIRNVINDQLVKIQYLKTSQMIADSLTKSLPTEKSTYCTKLMGLIN
ncbi:uncharacterized protein LOC129913695 [Episyrphus balteatus]|uniref:uncharacterized protein LOC129913695 n=1 Tax=Episyrphus balteatus TaxID=286459 RepID=UPI002484DD43|nr:uncharacterized protein LOC129913695 [Episyrphus balteatus]